MAMPKDKLDKLYTYAEYAAWNDGKRWELIEGVPYLMSPAPSQRHQEISLEIAIQLAGFLKGRPCKVFTAPFDVRLNGNGDDEITVVQPDIIVVCDKSKLDGKRVNGAPDMVVEVLSQANPRHDTVVKLKLYNRAGVREYWIADPENKTLLAYTLENERYVLSVYGEDSVAPVSVLPGCEIKLAEVFTGE